MTEKSKVTLPAKVAKVIKPMHPAEPEKAQIAVEGADPLYDEIRVKNSLKNANGDEVRLKEGAEVEVTLEAPEHAVVSDTARKNEREAGLRFH
jgi:hypothetical protein